MQGFMRYRWGDANYHALLLMLATEAECTDVWTAEAYRHNYHVFAPFSTDFTYEVIPDSEWIAPINVNMAS